MIVVTGATGNTGKPAVEALLAANQKVRAIGRIAEHLAPPAQKGAEPFVGQVNDAAAMTKAFEGADAVYLMLPSNPQSADILGDEAKITDAYVEAVTKSGVKHVVLLSSIGAELSEKTGPVLGLHNLEEKIKAIPGLNVLSLRPVAFMDNLFMSMAPLRKLGFLPGPGPSDVPAPMVATRDIGAYAARRLAARDFTGFSRAELHGQRDVTMKEVTSIVGNAIGKPGLSYMQVPFMMLEPALVQSGMGKNLAGLLIDLWKGQAAGIVKPHEPRNAANTTPTSIETFVAEAFAPAYLAQAASA
ncbi:MAG: NAD(P)H-binding protein [Candidatus Acidiferrales bacterium]